jgi:hypothetical protein
MSQLLYINSADRASGSINDFHIFLQDDLLFGQHKDVAVIEAIIPFSYYAINSNNDTFLCGPTGDDTVTLTDGNYTGTELATHLAVALNVALVPTYSVAFSSITGKFTYSTGDNSDFDLITDTKNYKYLGFLPSTTNSSASGILVSANVVNLSGTEYIDILSNLQIATENTTNLQKNVLARIYPNSSPFASVFYTMATDNSIHFDGQHLNRLHIQLFDDQGDALGLNGNHWAFTLKTIPRPQAGHDGAPAPQVPIPMPPDGF